jgi:hypothetical protein
VSLMDRVDCNNFEMIKWIHIYIYIYIYIEIIDFNDKESTSMITQMDRSIQSK